MAVATDAYDLTGAPGYWESLRRASIPAYVIAMQAHVIAASYGGIRVLLREPIQYVTAIPSAIRSFREANADSSQVEHNNTSTSLSSSPLRRSPNQSASELDILYKQIEMFHKLRKSK